jgi:glutathione S-transferase
MTGALTLWGSPHSLYTGKVRSYLIKKGAPFRELLPVDPRFQELAASVVRLPVIPVVETPEGDILQDTTEIIDHLEARLLGPGMVPETPVLRTIADLLDAFGCEYLLPAAMHYRWTYRAEQEDFLQAEFGRVAHTGPDRAARREAGRSRMAYFNGFLPMLGVSETSIPAIEESYLDLLDRLDIHFQACPYLLGGRPSLADFGLMAPLFAHLGRDPVPARLMKARAPNVFRWTERMNLPGAFDGEFADSPQAFFAHDEVPPTLEAVLALVFRDWGPELAVHAARFEAWLDETPEAGPGALLSQSGKRRVHPQLGPVAFELRGRRVERACAPQALWHFQRATDRARALEGRSAEAFAALLERTGGEAMMGLRLSRPIRRQDYVLVLG